MAVADERREGCDGEFPRANLEDVVLPDGVVATEVAMRESRAREILDVGPAATEAEVRNAFFQQVKHAHPDRETGSRSAFKLVKEAYDRLN